MDEARPHDDARLVEAIVAGDRDAFRVLVERETPRVFRTCYRILGRVHDAEDLVQETFTLAYRSIGSYRGEGPIGGWLTRIATRQALRRLGQRREHEPIESDERGPLLVSPTDPLADAISAERQRAVRRAVASLPEPYREVVALRFFGELSLAEVAASTGRPIGTVKTHLHRGLGRLRESLQGLAAA